MSDVRNIDIEDAIAATYQEGKGVAVEDRSASEKRLFTFVLMGVFVLVMMVCLVAGVSIYRSVAALHDETNTMHLESGLLVNVVRMNDMADGVQVAAGPEGDALVLVTRLDSGTYETRIYHYEGAVVQEYAIAGRDFNPDNAVKIVDSETFEFSYEDGLLTLVTDSGSYNVAIRTAQNSTGPIASSGYVAPAGGGDGQ